MKDLFGTAVVKIEGHCSNYDNPEIPPWNGYRDEFYTFFHKKYGNKWYTKIMYRLLYVICRDFWDEALFTAARDRSK